MDPDQFSGCLFGLALGDALGAPYEGGLLERFVWRLIGKTKQGEVRWTDDTQMALDIADSLLETDGLDQDALALRFAAGYRWSRGYGPGTGRLLKRIGRGQDWRHANRSVYPDGSYGNGAAMRAPVVGLYYWNRQEDLVTAARESAEITHAHPLGMEGAILLAVATSLLLHGEESFSILRNAGRYCESYEFSTRLAMAEAWLRAGAQPEAGEVVRNLGNGIAAAKSCVTAVYAALRFRELPFIQLMDFVVRIGGDTDTIGAMAGSLWGAARGISQLPQDHLERLEQRDRIKNVASALAERVLL